MKLEASRPARRTVRGRKNTFCDDAQRDLRDAAASLRQYWRTGLAVILSFALPISAAPQLELVEGQPLAANVSRLLQALDSLGSPLPAKTQSALSSAIRDRDAGRIQTLLDPEVLLVVNLNPEARVKVARGPAPALLKQGGHVPILIKIVNDSTGTQTLQVTCAQAGPPYAGVAKLSMQRQAQERLMDNENTGGRTDRFLQVDLYNQSPMTANLSGLKVEYAILLIYSSESGKREATLGFNVGEGTQDLGFRGEAPVLFEVVPAARVRLAVKDFDGQPTTGRFLFLDSAGRVYPPQARRLAPDLFFQKQIYRADGETVLLPTGEYTMYSGRGPEYKWQSRKIHVAESKTAEDSIEVRLERWINPTAYGYYAGDHHIHAAGCAHYTSPTEGVSPSDMFHQIKGEGLNVGAVLTWGPCFDFQQHYFSSGRNELSEPFTVMKYDIEVSGFGSQALGHVCLLNLREQVYPGADGSKNWPTWTLPILKWTKAQGGFTGYAHSGSGLQVDPARAAKRLIVQLDSNHDGKLDQPEAAHGLLPESFEAIDSDHDGVLSALELERSLDRVSDRLPNLAIPEMNGVGAQEIVVTAPMGLCDFISAMDTARIREWNCWYHLLNCGFPIKISGETDFPCMSGTRVGQGRVYVNLGKIDRIDYPAWCEGLAKGRSYVSDGYAHALDFTVDGTAPGGEVRLEKPGMVKLKASVAFSSQTPIETVYGGVVPVDGMREMGNTVTLNRPSNQPGPTANGQRLVEVIVNGIAVAKRNLIADDQIHEVEFSVKLDQSSWIALRQFPQLHTNPVNVLVAGEPIRASRQSAQWCIDAIDQLWSERNRVIAPAERAEAQKAYEQAKEIYRQILSEAPPGS